MNRYTSIRDAKGFTLVELIVVIVIMTILAGFSAVAYKGIAADLRMSSATNTITAALDNARAMSIKHNRYVMTVFRPRLVNDDSQQVIDIVVAQWSGDSANAINGSGAYWTYDRFTPMPGIPVRTIAVGTNVAGPGYGVGDDEIWWVSSYLPSNAVIPDQEPFGALIGILYNPEGRVVVRNAESAADRIWVDFDLDGKQTISDTEVVQWPWPDPLPSVGAYFDLEIPEGEPFISMTTILAVFNEDELRESIGMAGTVLMEDVTNKWYCLCSPWEAGCGPCPDGIVNEYDRNWYYTLFVHKTADVIQFNRYSGVPLQ